jgi:hypothetical protein
VSMFSVSLSAGRRRGQQVTAVLPDTGRSSEKMPVSARPSGWAGRGPDRPGGPCWPDTGKEPGSMPVSHGRNGASRPSAAGRYGPPGQGRPAG